MAGTFVLAQRGAEYDEGLAVALLPGAAEWLVLSTDSASTKFVWWVVRLVPGAWHAVRGYDANRGCPGGPAVAQINWFCEFGGGHMWTPTPAHMMALVTEAAAVGDLIMTNGLGGQFITVCGAPVGEFPALPGALRGEVG